MKSICILSLLLLLSLLSGIGAACVPQPPSISGEARYYEDGSLSDQRLVLEFISEEDSLFYLSNESNRERTALEAMDTAYAGQLILFTDVYCASYIEDQLKYKAGERTIIFAAMPRDLVGMPTIYGESVYYRNGQLKKERVIIDCASEELNREFFFGDNAERNLRKTAERVMTTAREQRLSHILRTHNEEVVYKPLTKELEAGRTRIVVSATPSSQPLY